METSASGEIHMFWYVFQKLLSYYCHGGRKFKDVVYCIRFREKLLLLCVLSTEYNRIIEFRKVTVVLDRWFWKLQCSFWSPMFQDFYKLISIDKNGEMSNLKWFDSQNPWI